MVERYSNFRAQHFSLFWLPTGAGLSCPAAVSLPVFKIGLKHSTFWVVAGGGGGLFSFFFLYIYTYGGEGGVGEMHIPFF